MGKSIKKKNIPIHPKTKYAPLGETESILKKRGART